MTAEPTQNTQKPLIYFDDVTVYHGKKRILDGVSLSVKPYEKYGLVGLNGAGKTTLIRTLLGLLPYTGTVELNGTAVKTGQGRKNLVYMPEKLELSGLLTGHEHIAVMLGYYGCAPDKAQTQTIARALAFEPEELNKKVASYSKGMAQKLGLIAAFCANRKLMVFDEPMSGLDPLARVCLKDHWLSFNGTQTSFFFSSHVLSDVTELCDRVGVLHKGKLVFEGRPEELMKKTGKDNLERAFLVAIDQLA